ncbi:T9SS type A sorting domain-containing protein [uncultured Psychroserpens sp.]|uniref:T9SS type A sorting domain-containing protein n=1 Tax=uncultured Psychroserpens sp. TaxID=255436 RepID=UPI00260774D7|nr:T9SS type A sorting domain-containing protein [uncultured Psychroserpens sp.]
MKIKLLILTFLTISSITFAQVVADQVDDFEGGSTVGWAVGNAASNPPTNIVDGGPDGAGDNYMSYTTTGSGGGPGSKMVIYSRNVQWSGNYTAQGIVAITFDVKAETADLTLRFGLSDETTNVGGTQIVTTNPVVVTAGSGWQSVTIPISPSDFTNLGGANTIEGVLASVAETRIISNAGATWLGESGLRTMDLDNITASTTLGISEVENNNEFSILPNPASTRLNIYMSQSDTEAMISVYDVLGKRVFNKSLNALSTSIDVNNWNSGVYLVRVTTDSGTQTKRFVKQ